MGNVLLGEWGGEFALPPFGAIRDEDFGPAFDAALSEARANVAVIARQAQAATFANTTQALELSELTLGRVAGVFYNLVGADSTVAREALQSELAPKLSDYGSEVTNNKALFGRVDALWQRRDGLGVRVGVGARAGTGAGAIPPHVCAGGGAVGGGGGRAVD